MKWSSPLIKLHESLQPTIGLKSPLDFTRDTFLEVLRKEKMF